MTVRAAAAGIVRSGAINQYLVHFPCESGRVDILYNGTGGRPCSMSLRAVHALTRLASVNGLSGEDA